MNASPRFTQGAAPGPHPAHAHRLARFAITILLAAITQAGAAPIPVADFFRDLEFSEMEISPDGQTLAMVGPQKNGQNLAVFDLANRTPRWLTRLGDRHVHDIRWVGDRIVFRMRKGGFDLGAVCAVDRDGSDERILIRSLEHQAAGRVTRLQQVDLLGSVPSDDSVVLVEREEINQYSSARRRFTRDVSRLNVRSGTLALEATNPGDVVDWTYDLKGRVRAAVASDGETSRLLIRDAGAAPWREILKWRPGAEWMVPVGFAADNRTLVVLATRGRDFAGLHLLDPATGSFQQTLWTNERAGIEAVVRDPFMGAVVGLRYDDGRMRSVYFDPQLKAAQAAVDRALPETDNLLLSWSRDRQRLLFYGISDRNPGEFHLFDASARKLERLGGAAEWLKPEQMAPVKTVTLQARDGLILPAYLTIPLGSEPRNLPMVLLVHGGPTGRDYARFDSTVQFLANRGYAVLQPQFRGSIGFGLKHETAGYREWGARMQDDLTDAVQWAIAQGIADPKRIAIFGASYGGFAALCGLVRTPDLYRCGINYVGVTDVDAMLSAWESELPARFSTYANMTVGDRESEAARLEAISPVNHADRIRAPVLLAYGELDPLVSITHGRRMARALKEAGKEYELIVEKDEGHGFFHPENRIRFYERVEAFLARHLK